METDHYAHAGVPFYDLWHLDGHVPAVRGALPPVLAGVRRGVLEIGAGTGLITQRGVVISEAEVVSDSHRPARDRLEAEVAAAGFAPARAPDGLLAWRLRK